MSKAQILCLPWDSGEKQACPHLRQVLRAAEAAHLAGRSCAGPVFSSWPTQDLRYQVVHLFLECAICFGHRNWQCASLRANVGSATVVGQEQGPLDAFFTRAVNLDEV